MALQTIICQSLIVWLGALAHPRQAEHKLPHQRDMFLSCRLNEFYETLHIRKEFLFAHDTQYSNDVLCLLSWVADDSLRPFFLVFYRRKMGG